MVERHIFCFFLVFCIVVASKVNKFNSSDSLKYMVKCQEENEYFVEKDLFGTIFFVFFFFVCMISIIGVRKNEDFIEYVNY